MLDFIIIVIGIFAVIRHKKMQSIREAQQHDVHSSLDSPQSLEKLRKIAEYYDSSKQDDSTDFLASEMARENADMYTNEYNYPLVNDDSEFSSQPVFKENNTQINEQSMYTGYAELDEIVNTKVENAEIEDDLIRDDEAEDSWVGDDEDGIQQSGSLWSRINY